MIVNLKLCHITILGVLSILSTHAQGRFESIAITLTSGQLVSSMELVESIADGHRTDLELILPQVVQTKISMVTIVQVSTTTIKEIVRVTETLSGTCAVAPVMTLLSIMKLMLTTNSLRLRLRSLFRLGMLLGCRPLRRVRPRYLVTSYRIRVNLKRKVEVNQKDFLIPILSLLLLAQDRATVSAFAQYRRSQYQK